MQDYNTYGGQGAFMAGFFAVMLIPIIIVWLITVIGMWKVFTKAGKPGWASIIPIYNTIVLIEITGKPIWWFLLLFIPCVNIVFAVWIMNLLSKSFGQSEGFTVGLILLPMIFFPILGFGNFQYLGPAAKEAGSFKPYDPSVGYQDPYNNNPPQE